MTVIRSVINGQKILWVLLANVSEGDWTKQPQEWRDAVVTWRGKYHQHIFLAADAPKFGQGLPPAGGWKTRMTEPDLRDEMAAFIGHKELGDEFTDWALAQRAEIDRLLAADSKDTA